MTRTIAKCIGILSLWIGLFLSGCQVAPATSQSIGAAEVLAEFPFTPTASRPGVILPVRFDGSEYSFLLDTGAEVTIFDVSLAEKLKGRYIFPARGRDSAGVGFTASRKDAPDARVGPLSLRHCRRVIVMDLGPLGERLGLELQGILGMDFLKRYVVRFDPEAKVVQFIRTGDVVLQLSRQDVSLFTVTDLMRHLAFVEGESKRWSLEIERGGEILEFGFETEDSDRSDGAD